MSFHNDTRPIPTHEPAPRYALTGGPYYEDPGRSPIEPDFATVVNAALPSDWTSERRGMWQRLRAPGIARNLDADGFIVEISSHPACAALALSAAISVALRYEVLIDLIAGPDFLRIQNSPVVSQIGACVFMAIQPADPDVFGDLLAQLHLALRSLDVRGPRILCDRPFRDSAVLHYRYGRLGDGDDLLVDGTRGWLTQAPNGAFHPSIRKPFFSLPDGVKDPFEAKTSEEENGASSTLLGGRYAPESVLTTNTAGALYVARDLAGGGRVLIREARPLTYQLVAGELVDASEALIHEHRVLGMLSEANIAARPLGRFTQAGHQFLVLESVPARQFRNFCVQPGNGLLPFIHKTGVLGKFLPTFRLLGELLVSALATAHGLDIAIRDLSVFTVLVCENPMRIHFGDVRSSVIVGEPAATSRSVSPKDTSVAHEDPARLYHSDWNGASLVLLSTMFPSVEFFELAPSSRIGAVLKWLASIGVPAAALHTVEAIRAADPLAACAALAELPCAWQTDNG